MPHLEALFTPSVENGALVLIDQNLIRLRHLFELLLSCRRATTTYPRFIQRKRRFHAPTPRLVVGVLIRVVLPARRVQHHSPQSTEGKNEETLTWPAFCRPS